MSAVEQPALVEALVLTTYIYVLHYFTRVRGCPSGAVITPRQIASSVQYVPAQPSAGNITNGKRDDLSHSPAPPAVC